MYESMGQAEFVFAVDTNTSAWDTRKALTAFCTGQLDDVEEAENVAEIPSRSRFSNGAFERKSFLDACGAEVEAGFAAIIVREKADSARTNVVCSRPLDTPGEGGAFKRRRRRDDTGQMRLVRVPTLGSVGIMFSAMPSAKQIEIMQQRAAAFAEHYVRDYLHGLGTRMTIQGFRLLRVETSFTYNEVRLPSAA